MTTKERRILHVLPHPGGGGETYVKQLARMRGYRSEVTFIAPRSEPSTGVLAGALRAQLRSRRWDLLHAHGELAAALCLPSLAIRPSIVTIHGLHLVRRLDGWAKAAAGCSLRLVVRAASRTICVGEAELAEVESLVGTQQRLVLIRNGVGQAAPPTARERAAARLALGLPPKARVGLFLAALDAHKEPLVVARAALALGRRGVPLVLLFAGDGPLEGELRTMAADGDILRLVGFQADPRQVLAAADFFALPSRREGLSFSLLEAMAVGLPPVVSDAPGNPEAVGDTGIVVATGDVEGFQAAFERLALDESACQRLGERARRRTSERFDVRQMVEQTRAVYEDVLAADE